ncbi:hypothetical protein HHI36_014922 [Cryptolaemus montrouzieri]|uniref:Chibby n=1 Tax=Cryptolaemus montrouzieri TaxID=559131 RepID=A0ABD2N453_9CUCU
MPLFGNKFSPKKTPLRKGGLQLSNENKLEELVLDNRNVLLQLGHHTLKFQNGEWIPESGADASIYKTNQKLKKQVHELQEENNLLKVKFEILLNLVSSFFLSQMY